MNVAALTALRAASEAARHEAPNPEYDEKKNVCFVTGEDRVRQDFEGEEMAMAFAQQTVLG
jgi:ABC-type uncharacterized transport system substrate-binding protein